jgi:hypothetical protein
MKAVKTIVATAVIVFALTTVAVAGVQHLGSGTGAGDSAQVATQIAQQGDSVTLSAHQFAALLHAVSRGDAQHLVARQTGVATRARTHSHSQAPTHVHAQTQTATHAQPAVQATHHAETHHAETHAGTHDGSGHSGGCD